MNYLINLLKYYNYNITKEDIKKYEKYIGMKDEKGNTTLLYYLCNNENPSIDIIESLKKEKNIFDKNNKTPLMYYCSNKYIEKLNPKIINYFSYQIFLKNIYDTNALMYYLENNKNPNLLDIKLLSICKNNNFDKINEFDKSYETLLMYYCSNKYINYLNVNIINYFSNLIGKEDINGNTALMYYLKYNKNPSIENINYFSIEINTYDKTNITMLMCYCSNENIKNLDIIFINYFSNLIGKQDIYGDTALIYYIWFNRNPSIDSIKLLEKESNINNSLNITPLMFYCKNTNIEKLNPEIINYFSNQIGKQNKYGKTALVYYLEYNNNLNVSGIKLLEKEINIIDSYYNISLYNIYTNANITDLKLNVLKYLNYLDDLILSYKNENNKNK